MAEGSKRYGGVFPTNGGKHELDVLAVLSSAFPQWLTSRQIAQRVKAYADSYGAARRSGRQGRLRQAVPA